MSEPTAEHGKKLEPTRIFFEIPIVHTSESAWVSYTITNPFQNAFSLLLVMRYLVATGYPSSSGVKTEIVDLTDPTMSCILEDIPFRYGSAGGLLGTTPVICGGYGNGNYLNDCIFYGTSESISMNAKRRFASSVTLTNNKLWIMGGRNGNVWLDSTEFITTAGTVNGPTLPEVVMASCVVKFPDSGDVYLIGGNTWSGRTEYTNKVWVANPTNEYASFTPGPSMMTARSMHGCSTMSIGTKSIIVTAGGEGYLASIEILDPLSDQWVAGK